MSAVDYDEMPVKPDEAKSLEVHVDRCAMRYSALLREMQTVRWAIRRIEMFQYGLWAVIAPLLGVIGWELWSLLRALSPALSPANP